MMSYLNFRHIVDLEYLGNQIPAEYHADPQFSFLPTFSLPKRTNKF